MIGGLSKQSYGICSYVAAVTVTIVAEITVKGIAVSAARPCSRPANFRNEERGTRGRRVAGKISQSCLSFGPPFFPKL